MTRGILTSVYRNNLGDATNKGLSSQKDQLVLVGENGEDFGCPFEPKGDYLVLVKEFMFGREILKAIPKSVLDSKKHPMFGGNFIYTSDSRFPSNAPIKIFDRVEG